jgi:rRNA-processing protein FCF1
MNYTDKLEQFMKENWMIPSDVIEALVEYCNRHGKNFDVAVTAGRLYASFNKETNVEAS